MTTGSDMVLLVFRGSPDASYKGFFFFFFQYTLNVYYVQVQIQSVRVTDTEADHFNSMHEISPPRYIHVSFHRNSEEGLAMCPN